jgi:L-aspartate oxidase
MSMSARGDAALHPRTLVAGPLEDLPQVFTDVLVIGSGVAGCSAALTASESARVLLVSKGRLDEGNTLYAQGGIAAAVGPGDATFEHGEDTLVAGAGLCDEDVVKRVVDGAPDAMQRLRAMGVTFDGNSLGPSLGREGGHGRSRILHSGGDATGRELEQVLLRNVNSRKNIRVREGAFLLDLVSGPEGVAGAVFQVGPGDLRIVRAGATILATGGACRVFRESTNAATSTGDGMAAAYRAGAMLRDLEFVQFHPTVLYVAGAARLLLTEAVRGGGARLIDGDGRSIMDGVHPQGDLAPRDIVVRAMLERMVERGDTHVFLDMRHMDKASSRTRFPGLFRTCEGVGLDPSTQPLPVRPSAHYFIGGVGVGTNGATSLDRLYACGEVSASGLHGANRLASNSLLEGLVLGREAGRAAAALAGATRTAPTIATSADGCGALAEGIDVPDALAALRSLCARLAGPLRDGSGLSSAASAIEGWSGYLLHRTFSGVDGWELQNLLLVAGLMVDASRRREESRGTHHRSDFPQRDDLRWRGRLEYTRGQEPRFVPLKEGR